MFSEPEIIGIAALLEKIVEPKTREAFLYFLTAFSGKGGLSPGPGDHGFIRDFRVLKDGKNCFAFTTNQSWLLCYFRRPGLSEGLFSENEIREHFPDAAETNISEWQLRVSNYQQAKDVANYVLRKLGPE